MIKIGKVYTKQTASWCSNDPKGTEVKVVFVQGNFVKYKNIKRIFGFEITFGPAFILNKWSFRRIFIDPSEPLLYFSDGSG